MQLSIKQKIVIHVAYRQVFSAPVSIDECKKWIGISAQNEEVFKESINELLSEGSVSLLDGYLCVKGNENIISNQPEKDRLTEHLIKRGKPKLLLFSKLPFVKYIGISGSVAANNPTGYKDGKYEGFVDLDLFVICRSNCLWILFLVERIIKNLRILYKGRHFYCFNYVTDESFLEIYNKNFYTATEIENLSTIYDDKIYKIFLAQNDWHQKYYSKEKTNKIDRITTRNFSWTTLLAPINLLCYFFFCLGRALKRIEVTPLMEMAGGFRPDKKCNLKRISTPNGGYQEAIKQRFIEILKNQFPDYISDSVMESLFPAQSTFTFNPKKGIQDRHLAQSFSKYQNNPNAENTF